MGVAHLKHGSPSSDPQHDGSRFPETQVRAIWELVAAAPASEEEEMKRIADIQQNAQRQRAYRLRRLSPLVLPLRRPASNIRNSNSKPACSPLVSSDAATLTVRTS